jgi:hypothetical protein
MSRTARALLPLAVFFLLIGCRTPPAPKPSSPPTTELAPSPNLYVGRILALDVARQFAFVALTPSAPPIALQPDSVLITRNEELQVTANLRTSRQIRGRTLGVQIIAGQPAIGDEVVFPTLP